MAKGKKDRPSIPPPPQRATISRLSFLYQAATYLAQPHQLKTPDSTTTTATVLDTSSTPNPPSADTSVSQSHSAIPSSTAAATPPIISTTAISRLYLSHLLLSSTKAQQRLSPAIKHTICKRCTSLLIPGVSCMVRIENESKGGKKRRADVRVVECRTCGVERRVVGDKVGRERQRRKKRERRERVEGG